MLSRAGENEPYVRQKLDLASEQSLNPSLREFGDLLKLVDCDDDTTILRLEIGEDFSQRRLRVGIDYIKGELRPSLRLRRDCWTTALEKSTNIRQRRLDFRVKRPND